MTLCHARQSPYIQLNLSQHWVNVRECWANKLKIKPFRAVLSMATSSWNTKHNSQTDTVPWGNNFSQKLKMVFSSSFQNVLRMFLFLISSLPCFVFLCWNWYDQLSQNILETETNMTTSWEMKHLSSDRKTHVQIYLWASKQIDLMCLQVPVIRPCQFGCVNIQ